MASAIQRLRDRHDKMVGFRIPGRISTRAAKPSSAAWAALLRPGRQDGLADLSHFQQTTADHLAAGLACAVLLFNLDGLTSINQQFGGSVGADVVAQFGQRLRRTEPLAISVAHLGSDDFAILLSGFRTSFDLDAIALSIMRAMEAPFFTGNGPLFVSASIGVAQAPLHGQDQASLMSAASCALHAAKAAGGHVWRVSEAVSGHDDSDELLFIAMKSMFPSTIADGCRTYVDSAHLDGHGTIIGSQTTEIGRGVAPAVTRGSRTPRRLARVTLSVGVGLWMMLSNSHAAATTMHFGASDVPPGPMSELVKVTVSRHVDPVPVLHLGTITGLRGDPPG